MDIETDTYMLIISGGGGAAMGSIDGYVFTTCIYIYLLDILIWLLCMISVCLHVRIIPLKILCIQQFQLFHIFFIHRLELFHISPIYTYMYIHISRLSNHFTGSSLVMYYFYISVHNILSVSYTYYIFEITRDMPISEQKLLITITFTYVHVFGQYQVK